MEPIAELLRGELAAGEQVVWSGRPRQGLLLRRADWLMIPFSLFWGGFAIFWEWSVITAPNTSPFFVLFGIPFVLLGLYLIFGRFAFEALQRSKTYYAVTSERILIVAGVAGRKVTSIGLSNLSDVALTERRDGEGSISFGAQSPFADVFSGMPGWPGAEHFMGPRFDLIPEAKAVYDAIRRAQGRV